MEEDLRWIERKMQEWYDVKVRGILGWGEGDLKEISILGRTVRWTDKGLEYEADAKHRRMLL